MTRRAFTQAYRRVRLWIRRHDGTWPAERDVPACDRLALECLYKRQIAAMEIAAMEIAVMDGWRI
jgi:hypothetical protein